MKYIVKTNEMPWKPKFFPGEDKQYGDFKPLWQEHGTEQFEVRLTRIPGGETNTNKVILSLSRLVHITSLETSGQNRVN